MIDRAPFFTKRLKVEDFSIFFENIGSFDQICLGASFITTITDLCPCKAALHGHFTLKCEALRAPPLGGCTV
jgi:hypothetical protein